MRGGIHPPARPRRPPRRHPARPALPAPVAARGERWIYGRHAVAAALANPARRWRRLAVLGAEEVAARALIAAARAARLGEGEALRVLDRAGFDAMLPPGAVHQGWALAAEPLPARDLDDVLRRGEAAPEPRLLVLLDRVSDPQNVGAVLRSAASFAALALVVAEHGAPPVTGALAKAASGALETVPLVRAVNLARALDQTKAAGYWVCGLDEAAPATLASLDLGPRVALVLGSEGGGMRRLVRERCDYLARLPTRGTPATLNVAAAAAIALYELIRRAEECR
jgi:23S rRNA (guanosine2251-2'-O)-methyltransferase